MVKVAALVIIAALWIAFNPFLVSASTAQQATITHSITSFNRDGTATVRFDIPLPSGFLDIESLIEATACFGAPEQCVHALLEPTVSTDSLVLASFYLDLSPDVDSVSFDFSTTASGGDQVRHADRYDEIEVPQPQPMAVEYLGHRVERLLPNGLIELTLRFQTDPVDDWPVTEFDVFIDCRVGPQCDGATIARQYWNDDIDGDGLPDPLPPGVVTVGLYDIDPQLHEISIELVGCHAGFDCFSSGLTFDDLSDWVPPALGPDVSLIEFDVIRYNPDRSADVELEFEILNSDPWPVQSLRVDFSCSGESPCDASDTFQISDEEWSNHRYVITLYGIQTTDNELTAVFHSMSEGWNGASRTTKLGNVLPYIPEQPAIDVIWHRPSVEVRGYYLDGSAEVDIAVSARQAGRLPSATVTPEAICYISNGDGSETCQSIDASDPVRIGRNYTPVRFDGIRLPQGEMELQVSAGEFSVTFDAYVAERITGMSKDLWECFTEIEVPIGETCGGYNDPYIRKWAVDRVNIYRDGDPEYVRIFDEAVASIAEITNLEYHVVDNYQDAHVEAYVGHEGHPRVLRLGTGWVECAGCMYHRSDPDDEFTINYAFITVSKRHPDWRDEAITIEDEIRYTTNHELLHALIPVGHDNRPFSPSHVDKESYIRPEDIRIFRMIYSQLVKPGMTHDELKDLIVFDEDTLDYVPNKMDESTATAAVSIDVAETRYSSNLWRNVEKTFRDAGSISLELVGIDVNGRARNPGPTLDVHYADFEGSNSRFVAFSSRSWNSIIFEDDKESWSSAGGRWTRSAEHGGRARDYRNRVRFDPFLANPLRLMGIGSRWDVTAEVSRRGNDLAQITFTRLSDVTHWPRATIEVLVDTTTHKIQHYMIEWQFEEDSRYRYRVEADVVAYGEEYEIPEEVLEQSEYLNQSLEESESSYR